MTLRCLKCGKPVKQFAASLGDGSIGYGPKCGEEFIIKPPTLNKDGRPRKIRIKKPKREKVRKMDDRQSDWIDPTWQP